MYSIFNALEHTTNWAKGLYEIIHKEYIYVKSVDTNNKKIYDTFKQK